MRMAVPNHSKAAGPLRKFFAARADFRHSAGMEREERRALLDFWFGAPGEPGCDEPRSIWFKSDAAFDATLGKRFGGLHQRAASGRLDHWARWPEGALALVLLLDQVPRNLYRGTARAFSCDAKARALTRQAVARRFDADLPPVRRLFLYLPLEHSEDPADQDEACRLFAAMPEAERRADWLKSALHHQAVIARFGRFPHRNRALGRASSAAEEDFLREPGSSF
jgi:uncharacterized protein (DUF924 family)